MADGGRCQLLGMTFLRGLERVRRSRRLQSESIR